MTGFSRILNFGKSLVKPSVLFNRATINKSINVPNQIVAQFVRESHGRTMFIRPGKFFTKKYFDILHYHIFLAALPFAAFIGYQNLFVGPATLTETPEDYEPRHWEYQKNPVKRFLAKNFFETPERAYEIHLDKLYTEQSKVRMRQLEKKVKEMMYERQDYKGWFYIPVPKETYEMKEEYNKTVGSKSMGYDSKFTK